METEKEEIPKEIFVFDHVGVVVNEAQKDMDIASYWKNNKPKDFERYQELAPYGEHTVAITENYHDLIATVPELSHYYETVFSVFTKLCTRYDEKIRLDMKREAFVVYLKKEREKHLWKQAKMEAIYRFIMKGTDEKEHVEK